MTRQSLLVIGAALVAVAGLTGAARQQRDVRGSAPPPPSGTAALAGMVVSSTDNTRTIRQAAVVVIGTRTGIVRITATDASGKFSVAGLPADSYLVGASKLPYLGAVAGAKRPARPGTPIALADGQKVANVVVQLPPGAAISGIVTDDRGKPAPDSRVSVLMARMQNGERTFVPTGATVSTDERGRYRIYSLAPGDYIVSAGPRSTNPSSVRALADADVDAALQVKPGQPGTAPAAAAPGPAPLPTTTYAQVYYPGTPRASDAALVSIGVGEDRQGIDFRLQLVRISKIEGAVTGLDQQNPRASVMALRQSPASGFPAAVTQVTSVQPGGQFSVQFLAPGTYTLVASAPGASPMYGVAAVDVAGMDQSGIQIALQPPLSLSGRLVFAGSGTAPSLAGYRLPVRALPPVISGAPSPQVAPTNATGAFTISNVMPGRYAIGGPLYFGVNQSSMTWALQSVVIDGRDVTDLPVDIDGASAPKDLVVTYGDRTQEISGKLLLNGAPAPDYTIVVFPSDKSYWIPGSRRILTTRTGTDGQYRVGGPGPIALAAGNYLLAAVNDLDKDEQFDPSFLSSLVASGSTLPITLQPGEKKVQNLAIRK